LIDDLLAVARLESGTLVVRREEVDLPRLVSDVLGSFAEQDGREFRADLDRSLTAVSADADKLVQVLTNLISNAVKYSPEGSPVLVRARRNGATAEVSVEDRGPGLTDEEIGKLFGRFVRIDRADLRRVGGTGLGLYITKSLVEMQGGQIWFESEYRKGTTFHFTIPVAEG
ncbi:MAG TPA: ATP-binding protein, partial [Anaerolineales bacterium]